MAQDGYIEVHYNHVDNVGDALDAGTASIQRMLDNLETAIAPLKASWAGSAREQYDVSKRRWDAAVADMHVLLGNSSGVLHDMKHAYQRTDLNLAMRWAEIR
jgi:6 kDa early secretory antigenic target